MTIPSTNNNDLALIDGKQLANILGVCERSIKKWKKQKKLPEPLLVDGNRAYWSRAQIASWESGGIIGTQRGTAS